MATQTTTIYQSKEHTGATIEVKQQIGHGGQASIFLAKMQSTDAPGAAVVFKQFHNPAEVCHINRELLNRIRSGIAPAVTIAHIIELPSLSVPGLVMEYYPMGDLINYLSAHPGDASNTNFLYNLYKSLMYALAFLHYGYGSSNTSEPQFLSSNEWTPIIHRDIKTENVLVSMPPGAPFNESSFKLADFDMACFHNEQAPEIFEGGTYAFQPPEQWANPQRPFATPAGDVWAIGAIIHELVHHKTPREKSRWDRVDLSDYDSDEDKHAMMCHRATQRRLEIISIKEQTDAHMDWFMSMCLAPYNERPTARDILDDIAAHECLLASNADMAAAEAAAAQITAQQALDLMEIEL